MLDLLRRLSLSGGCPKRSVYGQAANTCSKISLNNLSNLLTDIKLLKNRLADKYYKSVAIVIKIPANLEEKKLYNTLSTLVDTGIDGIIIGSYPISKKDLMDMNLTSQSYLYNGGDISGAPIKELSEETLVKSYNYLQGAMPIISSGGINTVRDAISRLEQGADLIQIYSGLAYEGPNFVRRLLLAMQNNENNRFLNNLTDSPASVNGVI